MKIEAACHPVVSECPFNLNKKIQYDGVLQVSEKYTREFENIPTDFRTLTDLSSYVTITKIQKSQKLRALSLNDLWAPQVPFLVICPLKYNFQIIYGGRISIAFQKPFSPHNFIVGVQIVPDLVKGSPNELNAAL